MNVEDMRGGYTTGSCATAGVKAGLLALIEEEIVDQVSIRNPQDAFIDVPKSSYQRVWAFMSKCPYQRGRP